MFRYDDLRRLAATMMHQQAGAQLVRRRAYRLNA
jgi:hypothetical protein